MKYKPTYADKQREAQKQHKAEEQHIREVQSPVPEEKSAEEPDQKKPSTPKDKNAA